MLLKNILPQDNTLPKNHYEAKKILCPVGMENQKIHACPNDCILYRNDFAEMHCYPTYGVSRYKVNDEECSVDVIINNRRPTKVCWYLPIIPRFKRLFANGNDAKNLNGMQTTKNLKDSSNIRLIVRDGRQSIVYIMILGTSQEI